MNDRRVRAARAALVLLLSGAAVAPALAVQDGLEPQAEGAELSTAALEEAAPEADGEALARKARARLKRDDRAGAIALLRAELPRAAQGTRYDGAYLLAYLLEEEAAKLPPGPALPLLREASELYRIALAERRGDPSTGENRALLLSRLGQPGEALEVLDSLSTAGIGADGRYRRQVFRGDLLVGLRDLGAARVEYERAYASDPAREMAPLRLLEVLTALGARAELESLAGQLAAGGSAAVARAGYEALLATATLAEERSGDAARWLERWIDLENELGTMSPASLQRLPVLTQVPEYKALVRLLLDPLAEAGEADVEALSFEQRQRLAATLGSLAKSAETERRWHEAAEILDTAVEIAPEYADYTAEQLASGVPVPRLDLALDRLNLLHRFEDDPTPDLPAGFDVEAEIDELHAGPLARTHVPALEAAPLRVRRLHQVLGLRLGELGHWVADDPWESASYHLRRAIELYDGGDPGLSLVLARGLRRAGRLEESFAAFGDAARGFARLDDGANARAAYRKADEVADDSRLRMREELGELRSDIGLVDFGFFPANDPGWYVGGAWGQRRANIDRGAYIKDLNDIGFPVTADFDDTDAAWRAYVGYRFEGALAFELGYTHLGTIESRVGDASGGLVDLEDLAEAAVAFHPTAAEGVTAIVRGNLIDLGPLRATASAGLWYWDAEVNIRIADGPAASFERDGLDPILGLGLGMDLGRGVSLRADYAKYFVDDEDLDLLSVALELAF
ncbi:MAG: hypothetical protein AAF682_31610 [Planctomycetota bacterium]